MYKFASLILIQLAVALIAADIGLTPDCHTSAAIAERMTSAYGCVPSAVYFYIVAGGGAKYCDEYVCFICPLA